LKTELFDPGPWHSLLGTLLASNKSFLCFAVASQEVADHYFYEADQLPRA
jgi:hypothetical protein